MFESAVVYVGVAVAFAGLIFCTKPIRRLRMPTRLRGLTMVLVGLMVIGLGLTLPARESRRSRVETSLDEFAPTWQFGESHAIGVAAPPARVFDAIKRVRADELPLFRTLIWIRAGGHPPPENIRAAEARGQSLIDVATSTTFALLAETPPRELVVGTVVGYPPGRRPKATPEIFLKPLPPGYALATMNFVVTPDGSGSVVSTETRVFANSPSARRRFAAYWRVIYPGSAIIRRMWLRAIKRRATSPNGT